LPSDAVLCTVFVAAATDGGQAIATLDANLCDRGSDDLDRAGSVWALSDLHTIQFHTEPPALLEWDRVPGKVFYALGDMYLHDVAKQGQLSRLLE